VSAERWITLLLGSSMLASLALLAVYVLDLGGAPLEGALLAVALGGVGVAIVVWAVALMHAPPEVEERHVLASPPPAREAAAEAMDLPSITRRRFLVRLMLGAGGLLAAALALPAFSLGPQPGRALFESGWRRGARLVGTDGQPIRPDDLVADAVRTVFPEGEVGRPDSPAMLIRLRPSDLQLPVDRLGYDHESCVAYSKICTHAGCPVSLYEQETGRILCPCHQSQFLVTQGAKPVFGPATRSLPQLPLGVDDEGFFVARSDYIEAVGPTYWNRERI